MVTDLSKSNNIGKDLNKIFTKHRTSLPIIKEIGKLQYKKFPYNIRFTNLQVNDNVVLDNLLKKFSSTDYRKFFRYSYTDCYHNFSIFFTNIKIFNELLKVNRLISTCGEIRYIEHANLTKVTTSIDTEYVKKVPYPTTPYKVMIGGKISIKSRDYISKNFKELLESKDLVAPTATDRLFSLTRDFSVPTWYMTSDKGYWVRPIYFWVSDPKYVLPITMLVTGFVKKITKFEVIND